MKGYLTVAQAAAAIGRAESTIKEHIANGRLPAEMFAGAWFIRATDLARITELKRGRPRKKLRATR